MRPPDIRYTWNGDAALAYQVLGQGSFDLVLVPGFISNLDIQWEDPGFVQMARRMAAFARLILIDKRGTGLSDRQMPGDRPALDVAADDIRAVMDATGSSRAALFGAFDGATIARHFAALHPERTRALTLYAPAFPAASAPLLEVIEKAWGHGNSAALLAPEQANDIRFRSWWGRFERLSASPREAAALLGRSEERPKASNLTAPALFIHRSGDAVVPIAQGRALAASIAGARFVELPGRDHLMWSGEVNRLIDVVEEFLTGSAPVPINSRILAALLVTRIVSPERLMARLGEDRWQDRLERFATAANEAITHQSGQATPGQPISPRGRFDSPGAAIRAAFAIKDIGQTLELPIAIGLNVGEVDKDQRVPSGLAFFVAEDIARQAAAGEVLTSRVLADLCGSLGQSFFDHEPLRIEGVSGPVHVVVIGSPDPLEPREKLAHDPDLSRLSGREREVLKLVAEGMSNSAIAGELRLSDHTIKRHVANILMKLDLPTRAAAAVLADKLPA